MVSRYHIRRVEAGANVIFVRVGMQFKSHGVTPVQRSKTIDFIIHHRTAQSNAGLRTREKYFVCRAVFTPYCVDMPARACYYGTSEKYTSAQAEKETVQ
jgi:hypothetical protein